MVHKTSRRWGLLLLALVLCATAAMYLIRGDLLTIQQLEGKSFGSATSSDVVEAEAIEARLLAVGLHPTGLLSDLGVDDHMARLANKEVSSDILMQYADAIEALSERSMSQGQPLPPSLWDVTTKALQESGWTVYSLTMALASKDGEIHVDMLSNSYGAYLQTRPNALEGALSLLPLARAYVEALPEQARAERAAYAQTDGEATLLIWQALMSGTSRHNPLTHTPLWSHGYVGHFSVPHIHQYATGKGALQSDVWGVGGFNEMFVGVDSNNNQVEHLGISALLQGVAGVPGALLNAIEALEVMVDHENPIAANADRALNRVVQEILVPKVEDNPTEITEALRAALQ
ncbi:MAG: hypothetical protein AAGF25_05780 [Pseudomonadota bacterium]